VSDDADAEFVSRAFAAEGDPGLLGHVVCLDGSTL
jgi:hypothetical protein